MRYFYQTRGETNSTCRLLVGRNCLRGELGGVHEAVHAGGIGKVREPVGVGALAGGDSLHVEAEHSEATVLDLLHLELSEGVRVVGEAKGVEVVTTGVQGVEALTSGAAAHAVALDGAHEDHLAAEDGQDGLG